MSSKLYVGSLPSSIGNKELEDLFKAVGAVVSANVIMDRATNQSKGFAFVEMATTAEAQEAITTLNGSTQGGRQIIVSEAKPETKRPARTGGSPNRGKREHGGGGGNWR